MRMCRDAIEAVVDAGRAERQESQGGGSRRRQGRPTGGTIHAILAALQPDAGLCSDEQGHRTAGIVLHRQDAAHIPTLAEPRCFAFKVAWRASRACSLRTCGRPVPPAHQPSHRAAERVDAS